MWSGKSDPLPAGGGQRCTIWRNSRPATVADVLSAWQGDEEFRVLFNALLADAPYAEFRWETPAVVAGTVSQPFEFVLLDAPGLARRPDPGPFAEHFADETSAAVAIFPNLSGDAMLVAPRPIASPSAYGTVAAFVRNAPHAQRHALWQAVGEAMARRVGAEPVWLSTAGAGVPWLHVRLDQRPKYYGVQPYRQWSGESGAEAAAGQ